MPLPKPVRRTNFKGFVEQRHEADALTTQPGDVALVQRGVVRSLVIACPDGCGERLTINLDSRTGPAWRIYFRDKKLSLFPSVWRETGCRSHFILWKDRILWCERVYDSSDEPEESDSTLTEKIFAVMTAEYKSYVDVAIALDQIPWEVLRACRRLVLIGRLIEGDGKCQHHFRVQKGD